MDIPKAIEYYQRSAKEEDEQSLLKLSQMFEKGKGGIEVDYEKAFKYLMKASEKVNEITSEDEQEEQEEQEDQKNEENTIAEINFKLGILFLYGKGVERNPEKAIEYFEKAANLGSSNALNKLGFFFFRGEILDLDPKKALQFFELAASKNNPSSFFALALMYENGTGKLFIFYFFFLFIFFLFFIF